MVGTQGWGVVDGNNFSGALSEIICTGEGMGKGEFWLSLLGRVETLLGFWMMLEVAYCSICVGHQIQLAMKLVP